jgi:DNA-binding response OmpR family regulator
MRVFMLEDDALQRDMVARYLKSAGIEVFTHDSPIGATNACRRFDPDVVLVDLDLPAYDGSQVVELLRRHGVRAKFVIWSAANDDRIESAAARVGADRWFSKSVDLEVLAQELRLLR